MQGPRRCRLMAPVPTASCSSRRRFTWQACLQWLRQDDVAWGHDTCRPPSRLSPSDGKRKGRLSRWFHFRLTVVQPTVSLAGRSQVRAAFCRGDCLWPTSGAPVSPTWKSPGGALFMPSVRLRGFGFRVHGNNRSLPAVMRLNDNRHHRDHTSTHAAQSGAGCFQGGRFHLICFRRGPFLFSFLGFGGFELRTGLVLVQGRD